jgi:carbon storage regulator CsrA
MLVLARRLNERILFPCIQAAIEVVAVRGSVVRLGIEAPPESMSSARRSLPR